MVSSLLNTYASQIRTRRDNCYVMQNSSYLRQILGTSPHVTNVYAEKQLAVRGLTLSSDCNSMAVLLTCKMARFLLNTYTINSVVFSTFYRQLLATSCPVFEVGLFLPLS